MMHSGILLRRVEWLTGGGGVRAHGVSHLVVRLPKAMGVAA